MTATRSARFALLGVLGLLVVVAGVARLAGGSGSHSGSGSAQGPSSAFEGPLMPSGLRAAGFSLTDQNGRQVSLAGDRGHLVVLTFLHSKCPDACPLTAEAIKGALNTLPDGGRGVDVIAITAEPAQDTPANRRAFLVKHEMTGRMSYLNGRQAQLQRVWDAYHVQPVLPGSDHSAFTILIDRRGVERVGYPVDQLTPESLAHDIGVLQREPA
jgi:protein SCO1/2